MTRIPLPDPNEAPAWRLAADASRQQFPTLPERAAYYDAMAVPDGARVAAG
jgi:hypothetical protein